MKTKDWFLVGLRLMGVWMLLDCAGELVFYIDKYEGLYNTSIYSINAFLVHATIDLALGGVLLIFSREIANLFQWNWANHDDLTQACEQCGYDLRGGHKKCPECGTQVKSAS